MRLLGDYNLEEMVSHLLKEVKDFRIENYQNGTTIVFKSLGRLNPVKVDNWLYFDSNGKQLHKTVAI
tara:strand:- start:51 stop:251 length:201 start_codon:yes stop_codon:yes gene_type:complete